ncbi:MAG: AraC family transcriptional regulator [Marinilabiliaceae bacterium]|nr:AraC family transcriptional regulator [Marinilabiliaceae bacterium]
MIYIMPTLFNILLVIFFTHKFGSPSTSNADYFWSIYTHPVMAINIIFMLFCIAQLILLAWLLGLQLNKYNIRLDNYFADTDNLHLKWVRYLFLSALIFAIIIILSLIFYSVTLSLVVVSLNSIFYIAFGLFYIHYPLIYTIIKPILGESTTQAELSQEKLFYRKKTWADLKSIILTQKYYLKAELNIGQLAQYLTIGKTTLSNLINREDGVNFHSWINELRIEESKKKIKENPHCSFSEVAEMVGISEVSNFSRRFKNIYRQIAIDMEN